jgi:hypothetical protein
MTDITFPDSIKTETEREAYRRGWSEGGPVPTQTLLERHETVTEAVRDVSEAYHTYTEGAHYCNVVLPRLRELAGFEDGGRGTFQIQPGPAEGMALDRLTEVFRQGYINRTEAELAQQARHPQHRTD